MLIIAPQRLKDDLVDFFGGILYPGVSRRFDGVPAYAMRRKGEKHARPGSEHADKGKIMLSRTNVKKALAVQEFEELTQR